MSAISHRKSRSGGSYIISGMDSPGREKKQLNGSNGSLIIPHSLAHHNPRDDIEAVKVVLADDNAKDEYEGDDERQRGERKTNGTGAATVVAEGKRKKKRRYSHKKPASSPGGPFPKGAAEIQTFGTLFSETLFFYFPGSRLLTSYSL